MLQEHNDLAEASFAELPKTVACLVTPNRSIDPKMTVEDVGSILRRDRDLSYLPVVDEERPIGLIRRLDFMDIFLSNYGRELHGRKPATFFMDPQPLLIEESLSLEEASRQVTRSTNRHVDPHAFIITCDGRYQGLGWTMDLLEKITDLRVHSARYANPLTLLPGNVPIQEHIEALLKSRQPFAAAYCDLDCFKPFNDIYGYKKGDQVIQMLGRILVEHADANLDFVGHIGGDDFMVIFTSPDWRERCEQILEVFAYQAPRFYHKEDRRRGGIVTHDRQGKEQFFNLLSLSIGVIQPDPDHCHSHHDVAALATDAKHEAKQQSGNSLFIDRRRQVFRSPESTDHEVDGPE
jgi:diguanylate cyclase (GGDEF)-like protein